MQRSAICLTDPKPVVGVSATGASRRLQVAGRLGFPPPPSINANASGTTCSINGVYQPPLFPPTGVPATSAPVQLYGFSSFSFLWEFLRIPYAAPLGNVSAAVTALCAMDYATANATYGDNGFLFSYCSLGSFIVSLLGTGYGVPLNTTTVTVLPSNLGLSYAAGAMIYSVNNLPWQLNATANNGTVVAGSTTAPLSVALSAGLGAPLALFAVGCCVLLVRLRRSSDKGSVGSLNVGGEGRATAGGSAWSAGRSSISSSAGRGVGRTGGSVSAAGDTYSPLLGQGGGGSGP
jgi:hypothetical protein